MHKLTSHFEMLKGCIIIAGQKFEKNCNKSIEKILIPLTLLQLDRIGMKRRPMVQGLLLIINLNYLVVDNSFRVIKHKLPIITVNEAQEGHQGNCDLGLDWGQFWQRYLMIPINLRQRHSDPHRLWLFCITGKDTETGRYSLLQNSMAWETYSICKNTTT